MVQPQFIILPAVTLVVIAVTFFCIVKAKRAMKKPSRWSYVEPHWIDSGWGFGSIFSSLAAGVLILATIGTLIPFNPTYWTFNHVHGTVTSVSNRFVNGTGDLSAGDYVLRIDGRPDVYNVQDNRIQGVKIGDPVDLTCTVEWVYAGQDQNNCFIRSWAVNR